MFHSSDKKKEESKPSWAALYLCGKISYRKLCK